MWRTLLAQQRSRAAADMKEVLPRTLATFALVLLLSTIGTLYGLQASEAANNLLFTLSFVIFVAIILVVAGALQGGNARGGLRLEIPSLKKSTHAVRILAGAPAGRFLMWLARSQFGILCGIQGLMLVMLVRGLYKKPMPGALCLGLICYSLCFAVLGWFYGDLRGGLAAASSANIFVACASGAILGGMLVLSY